MCSTRGHRVVNLQDYRARRTLALLNRYGIDVNKCQIQWYSSTLRQGVDTSVWVKNGGSDEWLNASELTQER